MASRRGTKIPGVKERFIAEFPGQEPIVKTHTGPEPITPPENFISTTVNNSEMVQKYPAPKSHPIFVKVWNDFIENIAGRENFKTGHLNSLEILCELYVEYDNLKKFLEKKGRSYKAQSRMGTIWKFYPEVAQLNTVQSQIKEYMKMLGLLLKKDHSTESGGEKSEWS